MKTLIVILTLCALGYVVDHWGELMVRHGVVATEDSHALIIYGTKADPACVRLEAQLREQGIAFTRKDLGVEANAHEMTGNFFRVGKMTGQYSIPVADVDGVMLEGATIDKVVRRLRLNTESR